MILGFVMHSPLSDNWLCGGAYFALSPVWCNMFLDRGVFSFRFRLLPLLPLADLFGFLDLPGRFRWRTLSPWVQLWCFSYCGIRFLHYFFNMYTFFIWLTISTSCTVIFYSCTCCRAPFRLSLLDSWSLRIIFNPVATTLLGMY